MNETVFDIIEKIKRKELVKTSYDPTDDMTAEEIREYYSGITTLKYIQNCFAYPVVFLHELSHLIFALITLNKIESFFISTPKSKGFFAYVSYKNYIKNFYSMVLTALSPILVIISFIGLTVFFNNWFLIAVIYLIILHKYTVPSNHDILTVVLHKFGHLHKYIKDLNDEEYNVLVVESNRRIKQKQMTFRDFYKKNYKKN